MNAAEIVVLQDTLNRFSPEDVRIAHDGLHEHPLRGPEASRAVFADHGNMSEGAPTAGVRIYACGDEYRVRITEVGGGLWSYTELAMSAASLDGYGRAIRDRLGVNA